MLLYPNSAGKRLRDRGDRGVARGTDEIRPKRAVGKIHLIFYVSDKAARPVGAKAPKSSSEGVYIRMRLLPEVQFYR